jgi:hypothetical protein
MIELTGKNNVVILYSDHEVDFMKEGFRTSVQPRRKKPAFATLDTFIYGPLYSCKFSKESYTHHKHGVHTHYNKVCKAGLSDPDSMLLVGLRWPPASLVNAINKNHLMRGAKIFSDGKEVYWIRFRNYMYNNVMGGILNISKYRQSALDVANEVYRYMIEEELI